MAGFRHAFCSRSRLGTEIGGVLNRWRPKRSGIRPRRGSKSSLVRRSAQASGTHAGAFESLHACKRDSRVAVAERSLCLVGSADDSDAIALHFAKRAREVNDLDQGTCSAPPAATRRTESKRETARFFGAMTAYTPAASAAREQTPRLWGACPWSRTSINGVPVVSSIVCRSPSLPEWPRRSRRRAPRPLHAGIDATTNTNRWSFGMLSARSGSRLVTSYHLTNRAGGSFPRRILRCAVFQESILAALGCKRPTHRG